MLDWISDFYEKHFAPIPKGIPIKSFDVRSAQTRESQYAYINSIPNECVSYMLGFMEADDLIKLQQLNKKW